MGENVTITQVLPILPSDSTIYVDFYRTRVGNQDERLLQVDNIDMPNTVSIQLRRVSAMFTRSDGLIVITIKMQEIQCHDHGYIAINISGVLIIYLEVEVNATITPCPRTAAFKWNATEFIICSVCVGNATWNVTWFREGNGSYVPVPERNDPSILTPLSFTNGLEERIVSTVEFSLGVIIFKLVNRRVFCSDGGMYKVSLPPESTDRNVTVTVTVTGYLESCLPMWEIKLIDQVRKKCSFCIGETKYLSNLTIKQAGPETSMLESIQSLEGESKKINFRQFLIIEASLLSGLVNVQFNWSKVQCSDEGVYEISAFRNSVKTTRNISISIDELSFLKPPAIIQDDGSYGGFAEGFNLSLACSVANIGCKKRAINLTLSDRNTTFECKDISLGTEKNESYACSLTWTEFNISRDLNETTFYCGYTYTHYNGTEILFESNLRIFVIPDGTCKNVKPGCKMSHPLGERYFIECEERSPYRPWEKFCKDQQDQHLRRSSDIPHSPHNITKQQLKEKRAVISNYSYDGLWIFFQNQN
ncbi:hypothetical protein CHS0354_000066 [Potamilus streckersoni]|uniref:Uncharacterized protein n=1 Tax=Potamilus streckersoni TaxID=2493646 RepID=A0AAE0SM07_9BIVA|nr:hypothetical protein CHS0354_000066 [Potamilus streckersoni]